jgi:chromosome segregation ATPase
MLSGAAAMGLVSSPAAAAMLLGSSPSAAAAVASPARSSSSPRKDLAAALSSTDGGQRAQELRARLVGNFQERMQLRRALIDLEAVNAQNQSEISKKQLESAKSEHSLRAAGGVAAQSATLDRQKREASRAIADLRSALASNSEAKQDLLRRLRDNGGEAKALREDIDRHASSSERKDLLDLQYR